MTTPQSEPSGSTSRREETLTTPQAETHTCSGEESEDEDLGLADLIPSPPSPPPIPDTFAGYPIPLEYANDVELAGGSQEVIIRLVGSHPLWGHHLWNAARTFSSFLLSSPSLFKGKKVLELGAGGGLPSIVAAAAGAGSVVITDYPDAALVDNIQLNVEGNLAEDRRKNVFVEGHTWGKNVQPLLDFLPAPERENRFDLLLLSDLVFNHSQHPALIQTINSTLSLSALPSSTPSDPHPTPCILIFYTHHRPHLAAADIAFFPALAESGTGWAYEKVVEEWTGPMFVDDRGDERVRGTVWGWRAWRVAPGEPRGERVRPK